MSTELAWAAGFFDGEGSIFVTHGKRYGGTMPEKEYTITSVALSVSQVRIEPLERFSIAVQGRSPSGPYKQRHDKGHPYYRWDACGRPSVHKTLILLWPYLSLPKKEQAKKCWTELEESKGMKSPHLPELPNV